ncbi:MAG: hypothetical protein IPH08_04435 [Rhodocyclaceae bacterium]|nr:hypothetical protein [Rhodocyclaceae bacterium]
MAYASKATYNLVGTDNTAITTLDVPGKARARLNQCLAPKGDRSIQVDSVTMGSLVNGMGDVFSILPAPSVSSTKRAIARTAMADYYENERVWSMPNAADVATTLDTYTVIEGDTDITVATLSAAAVAGMVFTIAGVYDVHPETKTAYSHLKQFTVVSSTTTAVTFSPAIYSSASGALQNVSGLPTTTAAVTFFGTASKTYVQPLMYHKEAFQFVTADLPLMDDAAKECAS